VLYVRRELHLDELPVLQIKNKALPLLHCAPRHEDVWESGGTVPRVYNLSSPERFALGKELPIPIR
jgi:hypothetical protein